MDSVRLSEPVCRGGSIDATLTIHPDNVVLAQDIDQHFRLICWGTDVIARDLSRSWQDGMFYSGSNMVVLDNPTETETLLTRDVFPHSTVVMRAGGNVSTRREGLIEQYRLSGSEPFSRIYLKEVGTILP